MYTETVDSYTTKVLRKLNLDKEFRDQYKTSHGEQIIEHIPTKKAFVIPGYWIPLIQKHRGIMQLAAMEEFKKVVLNHAHMPTIKIS